ncbi:hypothetical protein [Asticcacaulis machinosus]|uniref:DUF4175 domain-containing protein n=1 Tax=Asticcacaulis machinosus TaxID=2984211 RepID=A0ABT5HHI1_9CAUL|nr:hypothetical protein [Asticcacaulis machinosus]MDC7675663.1 hypothetical protein [Asticcacaulis machinosus]
MTLLLTLIAIALIAAAIGLLYAKWRGEGLPAFALGLAVPLAWAFLFVSAALWMRAYTPDFGLSVGFLFFMSLPLIIIGWQGYRGWKSAAPARERRERDAAEPTASPGKGLRITARLLSCLIAAPLTGMAMGLLAWAYMPGHGSTRYAWAVFFFTMSFAVALIVAVAAQRPWRATGLIVATGAAASALVSLPILNGSV